MSGGWPDVLSFNREGVCPGYASGRSPAQQRDDGLQRPYQSDEQAAQERRIYGWQAM
jgi:hypothetical protein